MKRSTLATLFTAAALAFAIPVLAQESRPANAPGNNGGASGGRPSGGSESTGSAVSRGGSGGSGGGGGATGSSSAGSSSSSGGSGMSTPSTGGSTFSEFSRPRAPERRGGDYAVPRGGNEGSFAGRSSVSRPSAPGTSAITGGGTDANAETRRAVPAYSRPREGRPVTGAAINRADAPPSNIIVLPPGNPWYGSCWDCYYWGGGYGGYAGYWNPWYGGYGFGLGYFYDPFGYYGYYSPYNDDYGYSSGYGSGRSNYGYGNTVGNLRLKVNPRHGQVYVDGYFAGEVDSFDGVFQRLSIESGAHKVEIRAEGYETVTFDVMITPGETVTYKGELQKKIR